MKNLFAFLQGLEKQGFYGALEIKFERGKIVLLRQMRTLKIETLAEERGEGSSSWDQTGAHLA
jgi:hypothetical protein